MIFDVSGQEEIEALRIYGNAKSSATGRSPNEIVYGFKPRTVLSILEIPTPSIQLTLSLHATAL